MTWEKLCSQRRRLEHRLCGHRFARSLVALLFISLLASLALVWFRHQRSTDPPDALRGGEYPVDGDIPKEAWHGRLPWLSGDIATWYGDRLACVTLTFDDGSWSSVVGIADLLRSHMIRGTFYIITSELHIKPRMYTDQLRQLLVMGHELGSHTHNHRSLWNKDMQQAIGDIDDQVEHSITTMRRVFGESLGHPLTFSYPFGGGFMDGDIRQYLRRAGFAAARTIGQGMNSAHATTDALMRVKAFPMTSYTHADSLKWYLARVIKNGRAGLDLSWCVFFGHGAKIPPYDNTNDAGYEPMSQEDIMEFVQAISTYSREGTVWSATVRDATLYIQARKRTKVVTMPVAPVTYQDASAEFCNVMHSENGAERREHSDFVAAANTNECLQQLLRRMSWGNLLITETTLRHVALKEDVVKPVAKETGEGDQPRDRIPSDGADAADNVHVAEKKRWQPQQTAPSVPISLTVCSSVFLDALVDDTSFPHEAFTEEISSRQWFCEAIANQNRFADSCWCKLQRDESSRRHHDDSNKHVYTHGHRHGNLENAYLRCCFDHLPPVVGKVVNVKLFISSQTS